jgi:hypothetical protein
MNQNEFRRLSLEGTGELAESSSGSLFGNGRKDCRLRFHERKGIVRILFMQSEGGNFVLYAASVSVGVGRSFGQSGGEAHLICMQRRQVGCSDPANTDSRVFSTELLMLLMI